MSRNMLPGGRPGDRPHEEQKIEINPMQSSRAAKRLLSRSDLQGSHQMRGPEAGQMGEEAPGAAAVAACVEVSGISLGNSKGD